MDAVVANPFPADIFSVIAGFTVHNGAHAVLARASKWLNDIVRTAIEALSVDVEMCTGANITVVFIGTYQVRLTNTHLCTESDIIVGTRNLDYRECGRKVCEFTRGGAYWGPTPLTPFLLSVLIHLHICVDDTQIEPHFRLRPRWDVPVALSSLPQELWDIIVVYLLHGCGYPGYAAFAAVSTGFNKSVRRVISDIPITLGGSGIMFIIAGMNVSMSTKHKCGEFDILINTPTHTFKVDCNDCKNINCNAVLAIKTNTYDVIRGCKSPITKMVFNVIMQEYASKCPRVHSNTFA